jgi:hypothetical protein
MNEITFWFLDNSEVCTSQIEETINKHVEEQMEPECEATDRVKRKESNKK